MGSEVTLGVSVGGIIPAVRVAAAAAVSTIAVFIWAGSRSGPLAGGAVKAGCRPEGFPLVAAAAAAAVLAMAVLNASGPRVGMADGAAGAHANTSMAVTITQHITRTRFIFSSFTNPDPPGPASLHDDRNIRVAEAALDDPGHDLETLFTWGISIKPDGILGTWLHLGQLDQISSGHLGPLKYLKSVPAGQVAVRC